MRGARGTGERRRTEIVRWSETVERNEADVPFSSVCYHLKENALYSPSPFKNPATLLACI